MPQLPDLASEIQNGDTATDASLVMDGIALLPPQCQKVFRMSRFEHKTNKQIAEELNISVRTVNKHIELALKIFEKFQLAITQFCFVNRSLYVSTTSSQV